MKYDFDQICDRRNTSCAKWDSVQSIFGHDDVIPNNPMGRLWNKEELTKLGEIAIKHGAVVLSDERKFLSSVSFARRGFFQSHAQAE